MKEQNSMSPVGCNLVKRFGDFESIRDIIHPIVVQRHIMENGNNSIRNAITNERTFRLSEFTQNYSRDNTYKLIELWFLELSDYVGVKQKLTVEQLQQLARLFYAEAYMLTIAEMGVFFIRVKSGDYGDFYGNVDPMQIMCFLKKYKDQRSDVLKKMSMENDQERLRQSDIDWEKRKSEMKPEDYKAIVDIINNSRI